MATVDEILGPEPPPSVDMVLGPEPSAKEPSPVVDRFLSETSVGRILDAFGQGAKDGWGAGPIGLSQETEKELRQAGVFPDLELGWKGPFQLFNQAMIRPAAAALDATFRATSGAIVGTAAAAGQMAEETGLAEAVGLPGSRLSRDVIGLADTLGIIAGTGPPRYVRPITQEQRAFIAARDMNPAETKPGVVDIPKAEITVKPPVVPTDTIPLPEGRILDKAGNINLDRIQAPEDVKDVIRKAAIENEEFIPARRGEMTFADTEQLADALGMATDQLTKRKVGQSFNAEEAVAARNLLVQSATETRELAMKAVGGSDADVLAFQEALTRHGAIQEQVSGMTAEAGRALSSFRIVAKGDAEAIKTIIESAGGRESIETLARMVGELETPRQVSKFALEAKKATVPDMLVEAWINALLSGPQTHVVNTTGNTLTALWNIPETTVAAAIGKVRQVFPGADTERIMFGETGARLFGIVQGAKEGVPVAWRAFKTEIPSDVAAKIETRRFQAIPSAKIEIGGKTLEIGGKQIRIPGRLLTASDELFKAIGRRQELNALAYRQASIEGLRGESFTKRVAELLSNPPEEMLKKARFAGEYQTYTKPLGKLGKSAQQFANAHPMAKLVIPFVRTPVNLLKYAGERTPLAVFSKEVRADLSGANGAIARDTAIAKITLGSAIGISAIALAAEGKITGGGPTDPRQRAMLYLTGWQPYSVKIGEMYYSYGRLDPFATLLGVSADAYEIAQHLDDPDASDLANLITASISKNLVNKTWSKGPADLIEAVNDPDRYGARYIQRLAGTVVPTGVAQIARVEDPYLRDAQTVIDTIKSRIPGLSETLLPRRDIWGEPIALEGSLGPDLASPIWESRINNDPVNRELIKLGIFPAKLERKIRGIELTPDQYDEYQRVAGRLAKYSLDRIVEIPNFLDLPEYAKKEILESSITKSRESGRTYMLMRYPEILKAAADEKIKEITGGQ